jgi:hypothetical protein
LTDRLVLFRGGQGDFRLETGTVGNAFLAHKTIGEKDNYTPYSPVQFLPATS